MSLLPWRRSSFAVLGLEATGPDPRHDRLVSLAWVPVEGGKAVMAKAAAAKIRPGRVALEPIVEALTGRFVVAHGAWRHMGFLSGVLEGAGLRLSGQAIDTAVLAARAEISPGLSEAASAFGLPVHRPHEADGEALTTAQLFMALASHLDHVNPGSVASIAPLCSNNGLASRGPLGKALRGGGTPSIPSIGA